MKGNVPSMPTKASEKDPKGRCKGSVRKEHVHDDKFVRKKTADGSYGTAPGDYIDQRRAGAEPTRLHLGDHALNVGQESEDTESPYEYKKPEDVRVDHSDKGRVTNLWNWVKSSYKNACWLALGCAGFLALLVIGSVAAAVLAAQFAPGNKDAYNSEKQDYLTNSSTSCWTAFYQENTSTAVYSTSPSTPSGLELRETSTDRHGNTEIIPIPLTSLTTTDMDGCMRMPCHHGTCESKDTTGYNCTCSPGWTGQNCQQDIDECTRNPCQHGRCVNQDGGYKCTCSPGWTGQNCQQDINECTRKPCQHGRCVNKDGGYKCTCSPGWTGQNCQQDIDECTRKPCQHGRCVNKDGGYKCTCSPGWTGQNCQQDINECTRKPCQHGRCVNKDGGYECTCSPGWTGQNCQQGPCGISAFRHVPRTGCAYGDDLANPPGVTLQGCADACCADTRCLSFQYNTLNECYLKRKLCSDEEKHFISEGNMYDRIDLPGARLARDPSWVVDSSGLPWVKNGVTYDAAKVLDGNTGTYWNPGGTGMNYNNWYIVLDLTAPHTLSRVAVNNYGDTTHDIAAFTLQKSQVGSPYNWEDVMSVTNVQGGTDQRQEFGGFQGTASFWKFVVTRTHSGWQPWLRELNLYGIASAKRTAKRCQRGWNEYNDHCYKLVRAKVTWATADAECRKHGAGLTSITSLQENNFITSLITGAPTSEVWIGLCKHGASWKWQDGSRATYTNWAAGGPDNFEGWICGTEKCTAIYSKSGKDWFDKKWPRGKWNDKRCWKKYSYLCEKCKNEILVESLY
ncbi:uncharacterized protein [Branchiostoma lanceolatum]|uniref:uncharacterized protein n=1 Tax=Branchiostoma lanceolatum TaxID=7740 RepID=UPI0034523904